MEKPMKMSSASTDGATESSMGDCSSADLTKGFCKLAPIEEPYNSPFQTVEGGFLGRARGWER
ncbi:MAG: hypothetical protein ACRDAM_04195 [Casimicrobium sp.]